ncbi:WXG100 family type VII secretion target [Promicromonospora sp. NPDC060271]|uniref:WXG100 family type VII secretion target n=1 Tax=Promicromonospora sp. NPDC060271 TaxID=3347089 RepID=UPI0036515E55
MTGNMYGADVEALRQLADRIARGGEVLDGVVRAVESAMPVPEQWSGMDADSFRDEWYGSHGPSIAASAQALATVADTVRGNADSQEATSDELSGGGHGIGVDDGRGIGVGPGVGVHAGNGIGVDADRPAEFYGEEPGWFRQLIDDLGPLTTPPGLAAYALELLGEGGWSDAGKGAGGVFGVAGVLTGGYQTADSMVDFVFSGESRDLYSAGDGWVGAVLSGGSLVPPVAPAFAIAGAVWGGASIVNGLVSDRPLTQNMVDYGLVGTVYNEFSDTQLSEDLADAAHDVYEPIFWEGMEITGDAIDAVDSAADSIGDAANDVVDGGRDLLEDAGDLLGF